jgi:tRNA pseudouridine32 synthase/23S rRNA pseudouridine746 synthase
MDYMMHRWGHIDPQGIEDRFDAGEIVGEGGIRLDRSTPLQDHTFIWYYRTLPPETRIPVDIGILHQDEHLLVVDKPHFLPTTPGGTYIQESALVRLRNQLSLPDLIPMHRLDRMTAGVLLFSTNPQTRGKYQVLFEKRQVQKEYECISAAEPAPGHPAVEFPVVVRNRMTKSRSYLLAEVTEGEPNAETRIARLETFDGGAPAGAPGSAGGGQLARYRLEPHTGKTHQLRVHMVSLGLGILNDAFYPDLLDKAPDDYARPLQLLARGIRFVDPISGQPVEYRSSLELSEAARARY